MSNVRFAAAAIRIPAGEGQTTEAPLRATAMVIDTPQRLCFISCDTLIIPADVLEEATRQVVAEAGVSFEHLLVCATHNHHAPSTIDILGFSRDKIFCAHLREAIVKAAVSAARTLDTPGRDSKEVRAELLFGESQESTVGMNSRYLLKDGSIAWHSYSWDDVVRPTGPCDPDMAVLAFRRPTGDLAGLMFNHSVHNIGSLNPYTWSPAFYGLAAQELERRHGGTALFLPGAFGSTHNTGSFGAGRVPHALAVSTEECVHRVSAAVEEGLGIAQPVILDPVRVLKRPFMYCIRSFDEAHEEATVKVWSEKFTPGNAGELQRDFRAMRKALAPLQGQERQTWVQVIRLGNIAIVGIPGELFASLGIEIRRRSPFRWTYLVGLANGTIGYVGDSAAYRLGGYQLWVGQHSPSAPGTGEALVEQVIAMLTELFNGARVGGD